MIRVTTLLAVLALVLTGTSASAAAPAVAVPTFPIEGEIQSRGLVFFVPAAGPGGAAAVGTAHSYELEKLVKMRRGEIVLGHSRRLVANATGFLTPPGKPFNAPGANLLDDYVVYALDRAPEGVRLLSLASKDGIEPGTRVQVLGVPKQMPHDQDDLFGHVVEVSDDRIEVDLDVPYNLRGWGGAPVIDQGSHEVIGILQAYFPKGTTSRVIASRVGKLREALAKPLDGGKGRAFASFARSAGRTTAALDTRDSGGTARRAAETHHGPILKNEFEEGTKIHLDVEYPGQNALVGDSACGTFVAGRAVALQGELHHFDVMLVLDTSRSTVDPTGADINGNGIVGKPYLGPIGTIFDTGSTDPGDSILAAEVAAARQLLHGLDPRSTRVGVITFAGDPPDMQGGLFTRGPKPAAITLEPLTDDYARIERALDTILSWDPDGQTHMAAGVDQATIELMGLRGALSRKDPKSEKIVLFFTDGQPTLPYGPGFEADNVRAVLRAAARAHRADVRIHSFAIGPDALEGPVATVEMAHRTDGYFTPVRHPGDLVDVIEQVSFANLEEMQVVSLTTGEKADNLRTTADGSWAAFMHLQPGKNRLQVSARASDGTEAKHELDVTMAKDAPSPDVPANLVVARNRLLEDCLASIKQVRLSAERERAEQVRKQLLVDIERERARARERAEEQRKALQLEVDKDEGEEPQ